VACPIFPKGLTEGYSMICESVNSVHKEKAPQIRTTQEIENRLAQLRKKVVK